MGFVAFIILIYCFEISITEAHEPDCNDILDYGELSNLYTQQTVLETPVTLDGIISVTFDGVEGELCFFSDSYHNGSSLLCIFLEVSTVTFTYTTSIHERPKSVTRQRLEDPHFSLFILCSTDVYAGVVRTELRILLDGAPMRLDILFSDTTSALEITAIRKAVKLKSLTYSSIVHPGVNCRDESDPCVEQVLVLEGETKELSCVGYGPPTSDIIWEAGDGQLIQLINRNDRLVPYGGCFATNSSVLVVPRTTSFNVTVTCIVQGIFLVVPYRDAMKKFEIRTIDRPRTTVPAIEPTTNSATTAITTTSETTYSLPETTQSQNNRITTGGAVKTTDTTIDVSNAATTKGAVTQTVDNTTTPEKTSKQQNFTQKTTQTQKTNQTSAPDASKTESTNPPVFVLRDNQDLLLVVVILGSLLFVAIIVAACLAIKSASKTRTQPRENIDLQRVEGTQNSIVPSVPAPPVPEMYLRQTTTSTTISGTSNHGEDHIYSTAEEIEDFEYSYAWTVPRSTLQRSGANNLEFVLTPNSGMSNRGSSAQFGQSDSSHSTFCSHSTSGASNRTYSNTTESEYRVFNTSKPEICPELYPLGTQTSQEMCLEKLSRSIMTNSRTRLHPKYPAVGADSKRKSEYLTLSTISRQTNAVLKSDQRSEPSEYVTKEDGVPKTVVTDVVTDTVSNN